MVFVLFYSIIQFNSVISIKTSITIMPVVFVWQTVFTKKIKNSTKTTRLMEHIVKVTTMYSAEGRIEKKRGVKGTAHRAMLVWPSRLGLEAEGGHWHWEMVAVSHKRGCKLQLWHYIITLHMLLLLVIVQHDRRKCEELSWTSSSNLFKVNVFPDQCWSWKIKHDLNFQAHL